MSTEIVSTNKSNTLPTLARLLLALHLLMYNQMSDNIIVKMLHTWAKEGKLNQNQTHCCPFPFNTWWNDIKIWIVCAAHIAFYRTMRWYIGPLFIFASLIVSEERERERNKWRYWFGECTHSVCVCVCALGSQIMQKAQKIKYLPIW